MVSHDQRPKIGVVRQVVVAAGLLCLAACPLAAGEKTAGNGGLEAKASRMLAEAGKVKSATGSISVMEIGAHGNVTLYQRIRFRNPTDKPLASLPGVGSFAAIPFFSVDGEPAVVEFGDYLPNGVERRYTAKLKRPVPPGGPIDIVMVGERMAKYKATKTEDGLWHFGPVTAEVDLSSMDCVFAVKLPPGARIARAEPKPDEVREGPGGMVVWRKALTGSLRLSVEYRYEATNARKKP